MRICIVVRAHLPRRVASARRATIWSLEVEIRKHGTPRSFDFQPLEHFDIAGVKPGMDFETAAKLSGSRFVIMRGAVARVHRALAQFMLDLHVNEHGLTETITPVLVRDEAMYGTNQLPKFAEDSYQTTNGWWLIPTSEVTLTNTASGEVLDEADLPVRMTAHTQCFRSEAGSAGKDTSGILRQHQFEKVEMVSITHPDTSLDEHERMTRCAETVLERLGLPYRTVILCTVIWVSERAKPMTSKCGCRGKTRIAKSHPYLSAVTFRRAA